MKNPYKNYDQPIAPELEDEINTQTNRLKAAIFSVINKPYFHRPLMLTPIRAVPPVYKGFNVVTALADGQEIVFNYQWTKTQTKEQLAEKLAHLVMHHMLGHNGRLSGRPVRVANIGADAIINQHLNMDLLDDWTARIPDLEGLTMEGATNVLLEKIRQEEPHEVKPHDDLMPYPFASMMPCPDCNGGQHDGPSDDDGEGEGEGGQGEGEADEGEGGDGSGSGGGKGKGKNKPDQNGNENLNGSNAKTCTCGKCGGRGWTRQRIGNLREENERLRDFHKLATARGREMLKEAIKSTKPGMLPAGFELLVEHTEPKTNWRTHLYKHVEPSRHDYGDLSRVWMSMGMPLEEMDGDHLRVAVCFDTSGSMSAYISALYAELIGLKSTFPSLDMILYYADAALYGPYEITTDDQIPIPQGGGGTTFGPFFEAVNEMENPPQVLIYLTDGYAEFPDPSIIDPRTTVLWFVPLGNEKEEKFPFGKYIPMDLFEDGE